MEICSKNGFYLIEQCIDDFPYERQLNLTPSSKEQSDNNHNRTLFTHTGLNTVLKILTLNHGIDYLGALDASGALEVLA